MKRESRRMADTIRNASVVLGAIFVSTAAIAGAGPAADRRGASADTTACEKGDADACRRLHAAAQAALAAGRELFLTKQYEGAIARFEEAATLDGGAADRALAAAVSGGSGGSAEALALAAEAWYYVGASHDVLSGPRWTTTLPTLVLPPPPPPPPGARSLERAPAESIPPPPTDLKLIEQRRKAIEGYNASLLRNAGDTPPLQRLKQLALRAWLEIDYAAEHPHSMAFAHAKELAAGPVEGVDLALLARAYERVGQLALAEEVYKRLAEKEPSDVGACRALARWYLDPPQRPRPRFDEGVATLERCAALNPSDPIGHYQVEVFLWDAAFRDPRLSASQKSDYADRGLASAERALKARSDFLEALVYKGLLLRVKASAATDASVRQRLLQEAEAVRQRANDLRAKPPSAGDAGHSGASSAAKGGGRTVRVGNGIAAPKRLKFVEAEYPPIAREARVAGVVILECTVGPDGKVTDVIVLKGIPLLDQAAMAAVRQWVYAPTVVDGNAVSVVQTVSVNFRLPAPSK